MYKLVVAPVNQSISGNQVAFYIVPGLRARTN